MSEAPHDGHASHSSVHLGDGLFSYGPSSRVRSSKRRLLSHTTLNFTLDGRPIRLVSGSVHYFRAPPSRWKPALLAAKAMGLNSIATYVPWNLHEPQPGRFRFAGMLDLRAFLEAAHEVGLLVLLRPGPYICSEWDLGGLPAWLLREEGVRLRSGERRFVEATERFFGAVAKEVLPYVGRPVVGLQVENEYGAFGNETDYMRGLLGMWERLGFWQGRVLLFTSDNGGQSSIMNGSPFEPGTVLKTINLDWQAREKVAVLRGVQPDAPAMIGEFWTGWFDHWGEKHHVRTGADVVKQVREVLFDVEASVNLYMFFGGTNFGFMSGANMEDNLKYVADVTSYDYDAFLTEHGAIRPAKYLPMRAMLREFWKSVGDVEMFKATKAPLPRDPRMSAYAGIVPLMESLPLHNMLDVVSDTNTFLKQPVSMEKLGGDYGFVMYRHNLSRHATDAVGGYRVVELSGVRDFAYVMADGLVVKTVDRNYERPGIDASMRKARIPQGTTQLDIIVENRGRVNYGQYIHDRKGLIGNVKVDNVVVEGFQCLTMSFPQDDPLLPDIKARYVVSAIGDRLSGRNEHGHLKSSYTPPTFFRGQLTVNGGTINAFRGSLPGTYCRVFGRGVLWINGFNVGRFNTRYGGPQKTLFVPGDLLREGRNDILLLHMDMGLVRDPPQVEFFEKPDLGPVVR